MKSCITLLLLMGLALPLCARDSTYKVLAELVFNAIKSGKFSALKKYNLSGKELDAFAQQYQEEKFSAAEIRKVIAERHLKFETDFNNLRNDTAVNWATAKLISTAIKVNSNNANSTRPEIGRIHIYFTDKTQKEFTLSLDECIRFNNQWYLTPEWIRLRNNDDVATVNTIVIATDEAITTYTEPVKEDTLVWFRDVDAGFAFAKEQYKYAVVYYEPDDCSICTYKTDKLIRQLKSQYNYFDAKTFNDNYVLIIAQHKDTVFLKEAGIKRFPGAAVFTGNRKFLHYRYNMELNQLLQYFIFSYEHGNIIEKINIHHFNSYASEDIKQSNFDTALIIKHLNTYLEKKQIIYEHEREQKELASRYLTQPAVPEEQAPVADTAFIDVNPQIVVMEEYKPPVKPVKTAGKKNGKKNPNVKQTTGGKAKNKPAVTVKENLIAPPPIPPVPADTTTVISEAPYAEATWHADTTGSAFDFHVDTSFIIQALDSLVIKTADADSATASFIFQITDAVDDYYCPFFVSKFLSSNDTIFSPSLSFGYILKYYHVFKNIQVLRRGYNVNYNIYEVLSKRLNRFIRYNETNDTEAIKNALKFQQQFLQIIPELEHLEKPLFITNLLTYAGKIDIDTLLNTIAVPYLDKLVAAKPTLNAYINTLSKSTGKNFEKEMSYVVWNNSTETPGYSTTEGYRYYYPVYFKDKYGFLLNNTAWYYYEHKADAASINRAIIYIVAALQLAPANPLYLDTYAHILYKKGDKKTAILYQQKALNEAIKMQQGFTMEAEQVELFKKELAKMKSGKL